MNGRVVLCVIGSAVGFANALMLDGHAAIGWWVAAYWAACLAYAEYRLGKINAE
jgi:prepilin-type processing-associated H-X9-DG protein